MPHPLSQKQMKVLKALEAFSRRHGYIPSVRELATRLRKSPTTVFQHLKALERKGYIRTDGTAHGWFLVTSADAPEPPEALAKAVRPVSRTGRRASKPRSVREGESVGDDWVRVPIAGTIAAGAPIEAVEDEQDSYVLPREMVPDNAFALRVRGNSMIEDHILDGDVVIVRPDPVVQDGEVAVALLEDGSATLKRVYREHDQVRLQPANSDMKPIFAPSVRIQGRVVGVWRACS